VKTFQEKFADEAIKWANMKVPYRHRGTTTRGCDCTGLIIGIAQSLGKLQSYKLRRYKFDWNMHSGACDIITTELSNVADCVPKSSMQPGDILVFKFGKCNAHAGIFIGNRIFVHSIANFCCQRSLLRQSQWSDRWVLTYRFNNEKMVKHS